MASILHHLFSSYLTPPISSYLLLSPSYLSPPISLFLPISYLSPPPRPIFSCSLLGTVGQMCNFIHDPARPPATLPLSLIPLIPEGKFCTYIPMAVHPPLKASKDEVFFHQCKMHGVAFDVHSKVVRRSDLCDMCNMCDMCDLYHSFYTPLYPYCTLYYTSFFSFSHASSSSVRHCRVQSFFSSIV